MTTISTDLEIIQTEGISSLNKVDPVMVTKKKDNKEVEVQDGWKGHILPFDLVQEELLKEEKDKISFINDRLSEITSLYSEKLENLTEDDKSEISEDLSEENDAFVNANVKKHAKTLKNKEAFFHLPKKQSVRLLF